MCGMFWASYFNSIGLRLYFLLFINRLFNSPCVNGLVGSTKVSKSTTGKLPFIVPDLLTRGPTGGGAGGGVRFTLPFGDPLTDGDLTGALGEPAGVLGDHAGTTGGGEPAGGLGGLGVIGDQTGATGDGEPAGVPLGVRLGVPLGVPLGDPFEVPGFGLPLGGGIGDTLDVPGFGEPAGVVGRLLITTLGVAGGSTLFFLYRFPP